MQCPSLNELPPPPSGWTGWPWTEESAHIAPLPGAAPPPKVTIITPSFNQRSFVEATIRSVLLQGYSNLEYLVLDGGSTDGTVDIIRKYARWLDYWVSEPDGGQSAAINRGLEMGSGQFATWINSDDMLCKNAIIASASQLDASCPNTIYIGTALHVDANGNILHEHHGKVHSIEDLVRIRSVWRSRGHIVQPEVLFPRELAVSVGGLDPKNHYTMDYELWGKFLLKGARFHYTNVPFGMFRQHQDQKTYDGIRQTRALLESARKLVMESSDFLSQESQKEILEDLRAYGTEFEDAQWKNSGRLTALGLPRKMVIGLRRLKTLLKGPSNVSRK